jgi:hypothetical protein
MLLELRDRNFSLIKVLDNLSRRVSWEWNRIGGCGRFTIDLPTSELININPDYDVRINIDGVIRYRGYVESYRPIVDIKNSVQLTGFGYIGQLERNRVNHTYTNQEISLIVKDVLDTYVVPNTSITYDAADIEVTDYTIDSIVFDDLANNVIKTLAEIAGDIEWGVDRNKKFFFKNKSTDIRHYVRFGKDLKKYDIIDDYGAIINRLNIKGGAALDEVADNTESQASYGIRSQIVSNSSITTANVAQRYGTSVLAEKAKINRKVTAMITNNSEFFEDTVPLGKVAFVGSTIQPSKRYGDADAIYGAFKYGGMPSMQIEIIKYILTSGGVDVNMNAGYARPDLASDIKNIEFQIQQLRNA